MQMSASLKERLKRAGRSYKSPAPQKKQRTGSPPGIDKADMTPSKLDDSGVSLDLPCTPQNQSAGDNLDTLQFASPLRPSDLNAMIELSPIVNTTGNVSYSSIPGVSSIDSPLNEQGTVVSNPCSGLEQKVLDFTDEDVDRSNATEVKVTNMRNSNSESDNRCEELDNKQLSIQGPGSSAKYCPSNCDNSENLRDQRNALSHRIAEKEEVLRKLNMVKMYRAKVSAVECYRNPGVRFTRPPRHVVKPE